MDYMPGTASLIEEIDKTQLVVLRDGRTLIGILRSIDQFANLVLHKTIERIHVGKKYGDIPRGVFVVRGENVVLLGEIDGDIDAQSHTALNLEKVSVEEILKAQRKQQEEEAEEARNKQKAMKNRGLTNAADNNEDAF